MSNAITARVLIDKGTSPRKARLIAWFYTAAVMPFKDFFDRYGKQALLIFGLDRLLPDL